MLEQQLTAVQTPTAVLQLTAILQICTKNHRASTGITSPGNSTSNHTSCRSGLDGSSQQYSEACTKYHVQARLQSSCKNNSMHAEAASSTQSRYLSRRKKPVQTVRGLAGIQYQQRSSHQ